MPRKGPSEEQIEKWRDSARRMMHIWHSEPLGSKKHLFYAIGNKNIGSISLEHFRRIMKDNGLHSPYGTKIIELFCKVVANRLHFRYSHFTIEQLEQALVCHIDTGATSPLQSARASREDGSKPDLGQTNRLDTPGDEQGSAEPREIDALSSSELKNKQSNAKKEPEIRIIPFFQDESNVATLSLEKTGQKDFNSITGELSQLLLAEVFLMPLRYDDGMICFKALTIEVPPDDIVTASKAGVEVDFTKFGAALSDQPLIGCFEDKIEQKIGQTGGVKTQPKWRLDNLPRVPEKGLRAYNIDLGAIFLKFFSKTIDSSFGFEFQAVVDLDDLVWISDSEGNFPVDQQEKGEAFDRVLVNKHLKVVEDLRLSQVLSSRLIWRVDRTNELLYPTTSKHRERLRVFNSVVRSGSRPRLCELHFDGY
jgi:hypothetical protein